MLRTVTPPPPPSSQMPPKASITQTGDWDRPPGHSLHHRRFLGLQDVVCQDPGHGHLNGELDPPAHSQLQEELSEPQLRKVAALLERLLRNSNNTTLIFHKQKRLHRTMRGGACQALSPELRGVHMSREGSRVPCTQCGHRQSHLDVLILTHKQSRVSVQPHGPSTDTAATNGSWSTLRAFWWDLFYMGYRHSITRTLGAVLSNAK